jgi:hypothetical protein
VRFKARVSALDSSTVPAALDGRLASLTLHRVEGTWVIAGARIMRSDEAVRIP